MDRRPEYNKELIGDNLRRCRQARNLSVEQVREYLGLGSTQSIYKWEEGRSFPQADNLFALMEWYGMELKDLLYGQRQPCGPEFGKACCSGSGALQDVGLCQAAIEHVAYSRSGVLPEMKICQAAMGNVRCSGGGAVEHRQICELILEQHYGEREKLQGVKRWVLYVGKINGMAA